MGEIDLIVGCERVDGLGVERRVEDLRCSGADVAGDLVVQEGQAASGGTCGVGIVELLREVVADALSVEASSAERGEVALPLGRGENGK